MNLELAHNLKERCLSDIALADISTRVLLVSSVQHAKILGKKNDNGLRASRSAGTGFKAHKDKQGNVYYNLMAIFNELGIKI